MIVFLLLGPLISNINLLSPNYSSALKSDTPTYAQFGASDDRYHFEAIEISVCNSGSYSFRSHSSLDMYGYLYEGHFNPSNPSDSLLISNDDSDGSVQFLLRYSLRAGVVYFIVVTTYRSRTTGIFSVSGEGPGRITFRRRT